MCRIILISDTHGLHDAKLFNKDLKDSIDPNEYNLLIHAGDLSSIGKQDQVTRFVYWFQNLQGFDSKIFIAGNHDLTFEATYKPKPDWLRHLLDEENLSQSDCTYLEDSDCTIVLPEFSRPIKIYGSPWQPVFLDWGFNLPRNGEKLEKIWGLIPDDTDILVTHCPPHGIRDYAIPGSQALGCEKLRERVGQLKLSLNVFGHIHGGYGASYVKNTMFVNASTCNEAYMPINKPIVLDLKELDGKMEAFLI